jgi:hypothetical protein
MVPLTRKGVIERDGMCSIRAGGDGLSAQWWIGRQNAVPIARAARRFAGANPDLSTATAAVRRSAGATLRLGRVERITCGLHLNIGVIEFFAAVAEMRPKEGPLDCKGKSHSLSEL